MHTAGGDVHVFLGLSGALEMGGEVNSAALMEFQGHINRFQVRQCDLYLYLSNAAATLCIL